MSRTLLAALLATAPLLLAVSSGAAPKGGKKPAPPASAAASSAAPAASSAPPPAASSAAPAVGSASAPVSPLTPRPDELPDAKASAKPAASYDDLMAEIAALRARVSMVGNAVWKSRMSVTLRMRGSHAKLASARLSLDGAQVWTAPKGFAAEDDVAVFEGGVAPGPHALTLEIERRDDRDEAFRTIDKTTATVVVPNGKTLKVEARLDDDSSMAAGSGVYDLSLKLKAKASP